MSSDDEFDFAGAFEEPKDFYKPPAEAHFAHYQRKVPNANPAEIELRLVGSSPLWGHLLWNAGIFTADYLEEHAAELVTGKNVLELGAAAALPSVVSGLNGAKQVVSTDYPDADLIANIEHNTKDYPNIVVEGYIWGNDFEPLLKHIRKDDETALFDTIILSDLVFNHTEHHKLLRTVKECLAKDGKAFVVFSPHRPWLLDADLQFFETAKEYDLKTEKIALVNWKPMFEEDEETAEIRARVYSFFLTHE